MRFCALAITVALAIGAHRPDLNGAIRGDTKAASPSSAQAQRGSTSGVRTSEAVESRSAALEVREKQGGDSKRGAPRRDVSGAGRELAAPEKAQAEPASAKATAETPESAVGDAPLGDPTQPGPALRELLAPVAHGRPVASPTIRLKGRILPAARPGIVILEVDGDLVTIPRGGQASISGASGGSLTVRVLHLTASEVRLELLPQGHEMVLH